MRGMPRNALAALMGMMLTLDAEEQFLFDRPRRPRPYWSWPFFFWLEYLLLHTEYSLRRWDEDDRERELGKEEDVLRAAQRG